MRQTCLKCKRDPMGDSEYCFFCDPKVPQSLKDEARRKGGQATKKIPHNLHAEDYLPLTLESLQRLQGDLIAECLNAYRDDLAACVKNVSRLMPRASELVAFNNMLALEDRLSQIEARRNGKLLLSKGNGNVESGEYSESD